MLARPPADITIGEIVALLEESASLVDCSDRCPDRVKGPASV